MEMIREHEGMQEWHCPACGRHMLVNWKPKFKRTILQDGDLKVSHNGFKANVRTNSGTVASVYDNEVEEFVDESNLTLWKMWLDESSFDNLWKRDIQ